MLNINIFIFIFIFLFIFVNGDSTSCICDTSTATEDAFQECTIDVDETGQVNTDVAPLGCTCKNPDDTYQFTTDESGGDPVYTVSCVPIPTTTEPPEEPEESEDSDDTPAEGACGASPLTDGKKNILKILIIVGSVWIILWTLGTLITNLVCKAKGHHRILGIVEEVGIILLFIFLGFFSQKLLDSEGFCKVTTILLHFFIVFVIGLFVFDAVFARSIVNGSSIKDGSLPAFLNYILPIPIALIPALVSYFMLKDDYALGLHCFISISSNMLWAFAIPTWVVFVLAITFGQLAFLACVQYKYEVDKYQLFWAFKSCKAIPILTSGIISLYFLVAFALDLQKFWLAIIYFVLCLPFGPAIFVLHTFQYKRTAKKLYEKTHASVYAPCGGEYEDMDPPEDPKNSEDKKDATDDLPSNDKPDSKEDTEKLSELSPSKNKPNNTTTATETTTATK